MSALAGPTEYTYRRGPRRVHATAHYRLNARARPDRVGSERASKRAFVPASR